MSTAKETASLIKRLHQGEETEELRTDVRRFLTSLDPAELPSVEKQLAEAGFGPEELRPLCEVHAEVAEDTTEQLRATLEPGHVLHTMVAEHDLILGFLDDLEQLNQRIQQMDAYPGGEDIDKLKNIAHHLVEAEKHHQREEEVLFPELEQRGVTCPPQVMKSEHEHMRARKKELAELADKAGGMDFDAFRTRLDETVNAILLTLRGHILKENNVLYAMAAQVIPEPHVWQELKERCDQIGYCCFTPSS